MIYHNIKVIHIIDGVSVKYNQIEENLETLFSFDENDNFIQHFTYSVDMHSNYLDKILSASERSVNVNEGFLFYSFQYQVSYAHYMTQCLPKLKNYLINYSDKLLIIPKSTYTSLVKEILTLLDISDEKIFILENNIIYNFKTLYTQPHDSVEYSGPGTINTDGLYVYNLIREKGNIKVNINPKRKVYLKKDGKPNDKFGNGEIGITRRIVNEDKLIEYLIGNGFEIIELGNKSITEKIVMLQDIKILISQVGANCMNFIFSNCPDSILLLSNNYPIAIDFYVDICSAVNDNKHINRYKLISKSIDENADPKNKTNSPFKVNINDVKNLLSSIKE